MVKILANDGLHSDAIQFLESRDFTVHTDKVAQDKLTEILPAYQGIVVRSATKVRKELIDRCPDLRIIARAGVGVDNIDVEYAQSKGIKVVNTPSASSQSVAELAIAHLMALSRNLHRSNREMPSRGSTDFKVLKKSYSSGHEIYGKTLGIIGLGNIGIKVARIASAIGMKVIALEYPKLGNEVTLDFKFAGEKGLSLDIPTVSKKELLRNSDFISLHVPFRGDTIIGKDEIASMKDTAILINAARGGLIDEKAALNALDKGSLAGLGLDVYEDEPSPDKAILEHPLVSISPHIGGSTPEAQRNIGMEVAERLVEEFQG